jgi:hypothetical protein
MEAGITWLISLDNPEAYQAQISSVCARVPTGISSAEELIGVLKESLGLPPCCDDWIEPKRKRYDATSNFV